MTDQSRRTAVVTGASRGIGAAIAQRLGQDGFNVVVNYSGSAQAPPEIVGKFETAGSTAVAVPADASGAGAVRWMFDSAETAFGGIVVVVDNAGIMKLATLADSGDALFHAPVAVNFRGVNFKGTFNSLREAKKRLRAGGAIVNFSSSVVGLKLETHGIYVAINAGIETMTAIAAKEARGSDITVNAVAPGPTATALFVVANPDPVVGKMSKTNPMERLGTPEDIASVVSFLCGPDGRWIDGQTLRANGGIV